MTRPCNALYFADCRDGHATEQGRAGKNEWDMRQCRESIACLSRTEWFLCQGFCPMAAGRGEHTTSRPMFLDDMQSHDFAHRSLVILL